MRCRGIVSRHRRVFSRMAEADRVDRRAEAHMDVALKTLHKERGKANRAADSESLSALSGCLMTRISGPGSRYFSVNVVHFDCVGF